MFSRSTLVAFLLLLLSFFQTLSQDCRLRTSGKVVDENSGQALEGVILTLEPSRIMTLSDAQGQFSFQSLCPGDYHLHLSHISCSSKSIFIDLKADTLVQVTMDHALNTLEQTVVTAQKYAENTLGGIIREQEVQDLAHKNIGQIFEQIKGISLIKNGTSIAKPISEGNYGIRLPVLIAGVQQAGQQWGNDHSLEIDPLIAQSLRLVRGSLSQSYFGAATGQALLIEPTDLEFDPHLHSSWSYFFQSNGRGHGLHVDLKYGHEKFAYQLLGTVKASGDTRTPDYFLNNTGQREYNLGLQFQIKWSAKMDSKIFFSSYSSALGILKGSQIGNLTDLKLAFQQNQPFFTKENFSYKIRAPRQQVHHHLLKLQQVFYKSNKNKFEITWAGQLDQRNEFDVRRGSLNNQPSLGLQLINQFIETVWDYQINKPQHLKSGVQFNINDNTNDSNTGILPLIPDYRRFQLAAYSIYSSQINKLQLYGSLRSEWDKQDVASIETKEPHKLSDIQINI